MALVCQMNSYEALFAVVRSQNPHSYELLLFMGTFLHGTASNTWSGLGSVPVSNQRSVHVFRVNMDFANLDAMVNSFSAKDFTVPVCPPGNQIVLHNLDLGHLRPISYSSSDDRIKSSVSFFPFPEAGITFLELVDFKKPVVSKLNADDIGRANRLLLKSSDFSLLNHDSKIGGFFTMGAFDPFDIAFKGHRSGQGLKVKLTPRRAGLNLNDYALTVTTQSHEEFLGSSYTHPIKKAFQVSALDQTGKIDLRLWDVQKNRICGQNNGYMIGGGGGGFSSSVSTTFERAGFLRDSSGNKHAEKRVSVVEKSRKHSAAAPQNWSALTAKQLLTAQKKDLIVQKKIIHLLGGDHRGALINLMSVVNRARDIKTLKIWDPYLGDYFLDFLTYLEVDCEIQVLSELRGKIGKAPPLSEIEKVCLALEDLSIDLDKTPIFLKTLARRSRKAREDARLKRQEKALLDYLNELRTMNLKIELRYVGQGKGKAFHDRFILAGGKCWSLGSSLNSIGRSHSLIYEMPYPELIEDEFNKIWDDVKDNSL